MKYLVMSIILCLICAKTQATPPFPPKVFANDSWAFIAAFAWPDENDKVLIIRTVRKTTLLSLEELGIERVVESSAGSQWYQNAIGYVTLMRIKGMAPESRLRVFYFRDKNGKESVIDLSTFNLIESSVILNKDDLDKKTTSNAALLLKSSKSQERQTAAIHLGQLKANEHLQGLTKLLNDDASYTLGSGEEKKTIYFVREAAKTAIRLINSKNAIHKLGDGE